MPITPHGGALVNRLASEAERASLLEESKQLPHIAVDAYAAFDIDGIAKGLFSPLTGFMDAAETERVLDTMTLRPGVPWTIPILLPVSADTAAGIEPGGKIALDDDRGVTVAVMQVNEKFQFDRNHLVQQVYRTTDTNHPGVAYTLSRGDVYLAGPITALEARTVEHEHYNLTPEATRAAFAERGWRRIVAFQTRNPIHRAHEYLTKCALEICDGLLIHPLMGATKSDDIPGDVRMKCYHALLENYYPKEHVMLSIMPVNMRYAGPREAVMHAIIRKNYGCTHFIVGRDHAGVGNYYGSYDAHYIFDEIDPVALGITPLFFEHAFYSRRTNEMATKKTCPGTDADHVFLSGTKVREMLARGEAPPPEFTRPEVAEILIAWAAADRQTA
ncbi:MAG TPA: sulfate adenylyltransferase [Candidatus Hydrogenedentes bacterium]|nr:sulfate adenylyltransferase [Candidatus Hydrogenedentota bacterium]